MKKRFYSLLSLGFLLIPLQLLAQESKTFIHVSETDNVVNNYTVLDHADLNANANQTPIMVHRYNVGLQYISYDNEKQGIWYNALSKKWSIFNQKKTDFKTNSAYNVLIPGPDMKSFIHESTVDNSKFDYTILDDNSINNNPNAVILVNDLYTNKYNVHILNLGFHQATGKWRLYYADGEDMLIGLKFNVVVAVNGQPDYGAMFHTSTQSNIFQNRTVLDNPNLNDNPDAMIFITQIKPTGTDNIKNLGVYYTAGRWEIYNETNGGGFAGFEMPEDIKFNVIYFPNKKPSNSSPTVEKESIKVFPNPIYTEEMLHINLEDLNEQSLTVTLLNSTGQCVYHNDLKDSELQNEINIDLKGFEKGVYFLKVETPGSQNIQKIMVL